MAALTISENDGTVTYTIGATLATGPYVVDFPYFLASEVVVKKVIAGVETLLVVTTDYTLSGTAADDGFSAGAVTLTGVGLNNCDIVITRTLSTTKATNFPISGPLSIRALNTLFSRLFSWAQDLRRLYGTAFRFPAGEEALNAVAAAAATRKGYIPAYHATTGALTQSTLTLAALEAQPTNAAASAAAAAVSAAAALVSKNAAGASEVAAAASGVAAAASAVDAANSAAALNPAGNITWSGIHTFTGAVSVKDTNLSIKDDADATKILKFQASGITTGTTRTLTAPDADDTIVGLAAAQALTNKTLEGSSNSLGVPLVAQGRLTLTTGVPVLSAAVLAATTIYYTPYVGSFVPIYDGTSFKLKSFAELSNDTTASATGKAGPAAVTTNSNYDLFVWNDAGTIRLTRGPLWTSDTARGTGAGTTQISRVVGIWTNTVAITNGPGAGLGTYVGTVRSDGSSQINWKPKPAAAANGGNALLGIFNAYNRVRVGASSSDSTNNWAYSTATWRPANNSTSHRISYIDGLTEVFVDCQYDVAVNNGSATDASSGINRDSTSATPTETASVSAGPGNFAWATSVAPKFAPSLGWHYLQPMEYASGAGPSWYGAAFGSGGKCSTVSAELFI